MMKRSIKQLSTCMLLSGAFVSLAMLSSCAGDDLANGHSADDEDGVAVSFNVSSAQDDAQSSAAKAVRLDGGLTRAAFAEGLATQGITPTDLVSQQLPAMGGEGMNVCIVETTVPGVNPEQQSGAGTRANISTSITEKFSSIGYRGTASATIGTTPWFYNRATNPTGTLVDPLRWSWAQPHAQFYGISPQVTPGYAKLKLSPETHAGTPYVEFEVEEDVKLQKDLMTACSGPVHYAVQGVAPRTDLVFRHALTAVRFKVGGNLSQDKTISKVEILNAKSKGVYTMATDASGTDAHWDNLSTPKTFTLSGVEVSTKADVNQIIMGKDNDNYVFYMIPQPLAGVQIRITFKGEETKPITANLAGTWVAGTTKTYAISEKTSTWDYEFSVTPPAAAAAPDAYTSKDYGITSYRKATDGTLQPVAWKVVGYDQDGDGTFDLNERPAWINSLSKTSGNGGTAAETGRASLKSGITNLLEARNKALQGATPMGSDDSPYDLSTKNGTRSTANSYVVSAPGHYRIPLVYGNAITKGQTNSDAYRTDKTGSKILQTFKDHAGNDITDPWITRSNGGNNAPDAARLVWADEPGLVMGLKVTGSDTQAFVDFEVPASAIKNGNAVIAVTRNNVVVWSWHLWFAPQDVLKTTEVTNAEDVKYNFTNETLGFKYTEWQGTSYTAPRSVKVKVEQVAGNGGQRESAVFTITQNAGSSARKGYATLYQFGRKDAMPGIDAVPEGTFVKNGGDNMSVQNGTQHPETLYTGAWTSVYDYNNLWSMNVELGRNSHEVVKTIYDPCPAGFKMPPTNAFTGFFNNGTKLNSSGNENNGHDFNNRLTNPDATIYFPSVPCRLLKGEIDTGVRTSYWSAGVSDSNSAQCMFFTKIFGGFDFNTRSYGDAVRPVAE